ncbi:S8 family peptidase [Streptosporangium carneum]|uniref:Peptidase n=1 Tax=Streptosporangium carneum TaxID=47481 RepID=A0A9W6HWH0_9ACTN|nr:S8 family serine peptidase [Streptosporangium carneum]GLK07071.1 peptidase [Streptosporangium carneum]
MHWSAHVAAVGVSAAALLSSPYPATTQPAAFDVHRVTLITGDVVTVREAGQGRHAVEVKPGPGRDRMGFHTTEENGELRVLPADMVPYLAAKRLDPSLFSVTDLIEQGYDDAAADRLPLLFVYDAMTTRTATPLESVNGRAVSADKRTIGQLWKSLAEERASLAQGVTKIWLDAKVKVSLDHSVPQVGAPEAWQAGFDGKGVKVAVLDTGVDATHRDLAGRVKQTRVFTGDPNVNDAHGHGTHVAATIAGGVGKKGVAPGAELIIGKVLGDDGSGTLSGVIEGMEWAAAEGASVINMSLGGDVTDGTDPLSVAVDNLTERTGALFVVAAGNDGAAYSVGSPGAATSALTVGAVDGKDVIADFSSRGPRLDDAPKPDLTAPGVGIVAARAAGTGMGQPVDEHYTAASGTSMATPHVAGAAAILKQRHPEWKAGQIKDALMDSATTVAGQQVDDAGAGRLDVARALRQGVTATGVVNLGKHQKGEGTGTAEGTIVYTNGTAAPVTLELSSTLKDAVLSARSVTVAAGGTAEVQVRVDLATLPFGRYGGHVTATAGAETVHTTLALTWKGPQHSVRFTAVDAAGKPTSTDTLSMFGASQQDDVFTWVPEQGLTVEVSEGTYMTQAINLATGWGRMHPRDGLVVIPELKVDRDLEVLLDYRRTSPVTVKVSEPAEQVGIFTYFTHRAFGSREISQGVMNFDVVEGLNVSPTRPVGEGTFEFASRWQLTAPKISARVAGSPYPMGFLGGSPGVEGRHLWRLVQGTGGARGKVAVLDDPSVGWGDAAEAAVAAGAVAAIIVMTPDDALGRGWNPGRVSLPIPVMLIANDHGQRLLEQVRKGHTLLDISGTTASPYLYDVMQVSGGHVPDKIVHEVSNRNTARVDTEYHHTGGFGWAKEQRFGWRPWQAYSLGNQMETQRIVRTPSRRAEHVSANGSFWQHIVNHQFTWDDMNRLRDGLTEPPRAYQPGQRIGESWHAPVVRPAIPDWLTPSTRTGDTLEIRVPEFVDASGHASRAGVDNDGVSARLLRNGELVEEREDAWGAFPAVPQEAEYRLELSTKRTSEQWTRAIATETSWTFRSKRGQQVLPLLQVDYDVRPGLLGFAVRHQKGVSGLTVKDLRLELSYDDGATWRRQPVLPLGHGRYSAVVLRPRPSLRVTAADSGGNQIRQTVIRAY